MTDLDALVAGGVACIGAGVYLFLGWRLARRPTSLAGRLPAAQFATFWLGLSAVSLTGAFLSLYATFQVPPDAVVVTALHFEVLLLCVALWGLLGYLTYLYSGKSYLVAWSVFYAAIYLGLNYLITLSEPIRVTVTAGVVGVAYATSPFGGPVLDGLLVVLIVPEFLGAVLYFTLVFRSNEPTVRFRVTLVSWSLIVWFGLSAAGLPARLGGGLGAQLLSELIGVAAALVILVAYYPPLVLRRRFGVVSIDSLAGSRGERPGGVDLPEGTGAGGRVYPPPRSEDRP
jgi:hypothetical protein